MKPNELVQYADQLYYDIAVSVEVGLQSRAALTKLETFIGILRHEKQASCGTRWVIYSLFYRRKIIRMTRNLENRLVNVSRIGENQNKLVAGIYLQYLKSVKSNL